MNGRTNILLGVTKKIKKFDGTCPSCGETLELGKNWLESPRLQKKYHCSSCKDKENSARMYVDGKYISVRHPLYKAGRYKTFNDAAFSSLKNYNQCASGHVYVVSNPAWEGWYKIGKAIDAQDRCKGYQTSSPLRDYVLEYSDTFDDRNRAERMTHDKARKLSVDNNGEWFKMPLDKIIKIIDGIKDEINT